MAAYVAFLRAINLGPRNRVAMAELRRALDDAGMGETRTHLQTGNVLLTSRRRAAPAVERDVERVLREILDVDVAVMVRTPAALAELAREHPLDEPGTGPRALHVAFLKHAPTANATARLDDLDFGAERFALRGTELFLRYPDGMGRTKMTPARFEKLLGTPMTVRTVHVVRALADMAA